MSVNVSIGTCLVAKMGSEVFSIFFEIDSSAPC